MPERTPPRVVLALPFRPGGPRSWGHGLARALRPEAEVELAESPGHMRRLLGAHDLVHTCVPFVHSRGPLLATLHGDFRRESRLYRAGYERLLRRASAVTVPSRFLQDRLKLPDALVIPNGIAEPTTRWAPSGAEGPLRVLVASKFAFPDKTQGTVDLLADLGRIAARLPLRISVAGGGPLEDRVKAAATQAGATWLGWQSDLPALFARHDVLVYRSHHDNQPVLLLEAMATGIPVIANHVGDTPDLLPADALADDETVLEERLRALADPAARQRLSRELRRRGDGYTWAALKPRWLALYRGLLA